MAVPAENLPQAPAPDAANLPATPPDVGLPVDPELEKLTSEDDRDKPLVEKFKSLDRRQQLQLIIGLAATVTIIIAIFMWSAEKDFRLLYNGLSQTTTAEIVQYLDQNEIKYQLDQDTGEVKVPIDKVHDIRIKLAAQGLPGEDSAGFEMLTEQQGFGTSQFMEKARYHRALEGELSRSIKELVSIDSARVHLAIPKQSVFIRDRKEASASVLVNLRQGRSLDEGQVSAIVHLVASSIPDLSSENVTVVDQKGVMLTKKQLQGDMSMSSAQFDFKQKMENYYIERIERILMPVVGFEGARAQVDADIDFTITESTAETFNPDLPAIRSEQTVNEESRGANVGGIPGALTNQPPGAGESPETISKEEGATTEAPSKTSNRATFNYELDKTISHTRKAPGSLKRLSVAVVVDDKTIVGSDGSVARVALTPEELTSIQSLVREAVGFSEQRGDSINVINASFHDAQIVPPAPEKPLWEQEWFLDLSKQGIGVMAVLIIIILVIRPVIRALTHVDETPEEEEEVVLEPSEEERLAAAMEAKRPGGLSLEDWDALGVSHEEYQRMLEVLRKMVVEDPRIVAQVVKTWLALDDDGGEGEARG